eukprot:6592061-Ditylum_brightwellii.AAC.1
MKPKREQKAAAANIDANVEDVEYLGDEEANIDGSIITEDVSLNKYSNFVHIGEELEKELHHL